MSKKIIINSLLVVLCIFMLDLAIGRILRHYYFKESSGQHFCTTYSIEKTRAELLVFGSSRANHHYVPEVFEDSLKMSFYNVGRDGTEILYHLAILKSVTKRYAPKIIILDYTGGFEKEDDAYDRLSSLLPYYRTHKEIRTIIELRSQFERIKLISEIYPFNSLLLTILKGITHPDKLSNPDHKGYIPLYKEWNNEIDSVRSYKQFPMDSNKVQAFREFLEITKKSGTKVFVIYSPIFQKSNGWQEIEICNHLCAAERVPFWDFSKDTTFLNHGLLFQDVGHLNDKGAMKFSKLLVNKIENYLLEKPN